jgi:tight adherence protein C
VDITLILGTAAVLGAVALLAWSLHARPSAARVNLFAGLAVAPLERRTSPGSRLLLRAGALARRIAPTSLVASLETKLAQAGHPAGLDLGKLLGIKALVGAGTLLLGLLAGNPLIAVAGAALGFFMPDVWLGVRRDKRKEAMRMAAADMIDQLTICVEAGLGFDAALARVASVNEGPLAIELSHTIRDMRAGVPRPQALRGLADRSDVPEIRQLVLALLQAQKHGIPIADALRVQASEMRTKRRQLTEEKAAKMPVKIIFPTLLCMMPAMFIVILGPAAMRITQTI